MFSLASFSVLNREITFWIIMILVDNSSIFFICFLLGFAPFELELVPSLRAEEIIVNVYLQSAVFSCPSYASTKDGSFFFLV